MQKVTLIYKAQLSPELNTMTNIIYKNAHLILFSEPCEVSIESCETYNGDAEPRGSRCDLSVNNAVIVDRIARWVVSRIMQSAPKTHTLYYELFCLVSLAL